MVYTICTQGISSLVRATNRELTQKCPIGYKMHDWAFQIGDWGLEIGDWGMG